MIERLLIIDGRYLCYISLYTRQGLSNAGQPIGVVYGWWSDVLAAIKKLAPSHLYVAWDHMYLYRKELDPGYKLRENPEADKAKKIEEFWTQLSILEGLITQAGIAQDTIYGLEADDLIAIACRRWAGEVIIYSRDSDLFQLLSPQVSMYAQKQIIDLARLRKDHDCSPSEWLLVKALAGDPGDNVIGVKGIGEKTALKIIHGQHKTSLSDYDEMLQKNLPLVTLPYPLIRHGKDTVLAAPTPLENIDWRGLQEAFLGLSFYSLLNILKSLENGPENP